MTPRISAKELLSMLCLAVLRLLVVLALIDIVKQHGAYLTKMFVCLFAASCFCSFTSFSSSHDRICVIPYDNFVTLHSFFLNIVNIDLKLKGYIVYIMLDCIFSVGGLLQ